MIRYGVSIVVCTYNGAERLPKTIRHIAELRVPAHIKWEFIIVNNASNDNTRDMAEMLWEKYNSPAPLFIVDEPNPGLSYARSAGFDAANYEFILMCDDDNWLAPEYLRVVYEVMVANPDIGALGGHGELVYEEDPPEWVKAFPIFAAGAQAPRSGTVKRNTLYGAGCVIRKSAHDLLIRAGFRSLLTDRLGKELSSGGDYELCYALVMAGYEIWYDERLKFRHYIPKDRFTEAYYLQYLKESSKCFEVLEPYKIICEKRLINFQNFRVMMYKLLFHYLHRYASMHLIRMFSKKGGTREKILTLRLYSVRKKVSVLLANKSTVYENYKHGRRFERSFASGKRNVISRAMESIFF